jgi:retron-type reverse transcriptase
MENYINELYDELVKNNEDPIQIELTIKYASHLNDLTLPVIFDIDHLALLLGIDKKYIYSVILSNKKLVYKSVKIPKKDGTCRELEIPCEKLKQIQRWILKNILEKIPASDNANGFCKKKSILTNSMNHLNNECVINMDLHDFFGSVTGCSVYYLFYKMGYTTEISNVLKNLCTYNEHLPQGAPTSPYISNLVFVNADKRLNGLAKKYNANYSRYADDISFSGKYGIANAIPTIIDIIENEGFLINEKKTRINYKYQRQEVTGIVVNGNKPQVNKKYLKKFKQEIYYCKKFGVQDHLNYIHSDKRFFKEHMYGKAYYINMINKEFGNSLIQELNKIDWNE